MMRRSVAPVVPGIPAPPHTLGGASRSAPERVLRAAVRGALKEADRALRQLTEQLADATTLGRIRSADIDEARAVLKTAAESVAAQTALLRSELESYSGSLEWRRLSVALYAPTGSGKSTIVEALTRGNGTAIGDGRKDYTVAQHVHAYGNFLLRDMPGIEGAEGKLLEQVKKALAACHVVLLVVGSGKEPDRGTLKKLIRHAARAYEFISIVNSRGRPAQWRRQLECGSSGSRRATRLDERVCERLGEVLGGRHHGHLTLDAHLAFVSNAQEIQARFVPDRAQAEEIFGTLRKARSFSGLPRLERRLRALASEAAPRIVWGNSYKALSALGELVVHLDKAAAALEAGADLWHRGLAAAATNIEQTLDRAKAHLLQGIRAELGRLQREMCATLKVALGEGRDAAAIRVAMSDRTTAAQDRLDAFVRSELNTLESDLRHDLERMAGQVGLRLDLDDLPLPALEDALRAASLNWRKEIADVLAKSLGGLLLGGWPLVVYALFAILAKISDWFGAGHIRRQRAGLQLGYRQVRSSLDKASKDIDHALTTEWNLMATNIRCALDQAERLSTHLRTASRSLGSSAIRIHAYAAEVTTAFATTRDPTFRGLSIPVFSDDGALAALVTVGSSQSAFPPMLLSLPPEHRYPHQIALNQADALPGEFRRRARQIIATYRKPRNASHNTP